MLSALQLIKSNRSTSDPTKAARVAGRMIVYAHQRVAYLKQCFKAGYRPKIETGLLSRMKAGGQSSKCIRIIDQAGELENYTGFKKIIAAMEKEYTDDQIEKICYGNAMRVIKEVIG